MPLLRGGHHVAAVRRPPSSRGRIRTAASGSAGRAGEGFQCLAVLVERRRIDQQHGAVVFQQHELHAHSVRLFPWVPSHPQRRTGTGPAGVDAPGRAQSRRESSGVVQRLARRPGVAGSFAATSAAAGRQPLLERRYLPICLRGVRRRRQLVRGGVRRAEGRPIGPVTSVAEGTKRVPAPPTRGTHQRRAPPDAANVQGKFRSRNGLVHEPLRAAPPVTRPQIIARLLVGTAVDAEPRVRSGRGLLPSASVPQVRHGRASPPRYDAELRPAGGYLHKTAYPTPCCPATSSARRPTPAGGRRETVRIDGPAAIAHRRERITPPWVGRRRRSTRRHQRRLSVQRVSLPSRMAYRGNVPASPRQAAFKPCQVPPRHATPSRAVTSSTAGRRRQAASCSSTTLSTSNLP